MRPAQANVNEQRVSTTDAYLAGLYTRWLRDAFASGVHPSTRLDRSRVCTVAYEPTRLPPFFWDHRLNSSWPARSMPGSAIAAAGAPPLATCASHCTDDRASASRLANRYREGSYHAVPFWCRLSADAVKA